MHLDMHVLGTFVLGDIPDTVNQNQKCSSSIVKLTVAHSRSNSGEETRPVAYNAVALESERI